VTYGELASWILGNAGTKVQISLCRGGEGEVVNVTLTRAALGISARQAVKDGMAREKVRPLSTIVCGLELLVYEALSF
jgi:hypothetical protein